MRRPFADRRPVGPFAQSDSFANTFLSSPNESTFSVGDEGVVLLYIGPQLNTGPSEAADAAEFFLNNDMQDFVFMNPDYSGSLEGLDHNGFAAATQYSVVDVSDPDVTVGQVEQALEEFLNREGLPVDRVTIHNTSGGA